MAMRIDCKNYESRTYGTGETVRQCRLDLAPEAPWRCPTECPGYQRKIIDGGWVQGSLANRNLEHEPELDEDGISMLDSAEDIINAVGPGIIEEVQAERRKADAARRVKKRRWWWPF